MTRRLARIAEGLIQQAFLLLIGLLILALVLRWTARLAPKPVSDVIRDVANAALLSDPITDD